MISSMLRAARGTLGLVSATMGAGAVMIGLTSHGGVTALVIGNLFQGCLRSSWPCSGEPIKID